MAMAIGLGILLGLLIAPLLGTLGCTSAYKKYECELSPIPQEHGDIFVCVEEPHCYCP